MRYLKAHKVKVEELRFPDHHQFTRRDFEEITGKFNKMKGRNKYIVTTEKDSVRIAGSPYYPHDLKASTFYLPIKVELLPHKMPLDSDSFDRELRKLLKRGVNGK